MVVIGAEGGAGAGPEVAVATAAAIAGGTNGSRSMKSLAAIAGGG